MVNNYSIMFPIDFNFFFLNNFNFDKSKIKYHTYIRITSELIENLFFYKN